MPVAPLRIAVVGAGLGGLTAAVALYRAGFDVRVYEQAPELTEVGGGINMGPNAARVLSRLGLGDGLDREAVRPASTHQRRWQDGRTLQRAPLNPRCEQLYGAPHLTVHRADLLAIIASGFPRERVHLGHRLVGLDDDGDHVAARFENGVEETADILVGADGINSMVRAALLGEEPPRFAGCVAYRGLVPAERIADLGLEIGSQSWVGPGGHFVHYFVSRGRLLNFVGWTEHDTWNREDWTDRATIGRALAAFEGWHPQIRRIIAAADTCFIWALFDRAPLPRWSVGRVTLLGDACHPMYPFMGQGAAQAIEDGATLAACLAADGAGDPAKTCGATRSCAGRASRACKNCRGPTRLASICPTARRRRRATPSGRERATARPRRCAGSSSSTRRCCRAADPRGESLAAPGRPPTLRMMDQIARRSAPATPRSPVFFRIAIGLFALLLVFGAAVTAMLVYESKTIRSAGGWGYLMGIFVIAVAAFFSCIAGVVCTALSLWRGEAHRRLSIAILIVSALVVWTLRGVPGALVRAFWAH